MKIKRNSAAIFTMLERCKAKYGEPKGPAKDRPQPKTGVEPMGRTERKTPAATAAPGPVAVETPKPKADPPPAKPETAQAKPETPAAAPVRKLVFGQRKP